MNRTPPALVASPSHTTTRLAVELTKGRTPRPRTFPDVRLALDGTASERTVRAHLAALTHLGLLLHHRGRQSIYTWQPTPARKWTNAERDWLERWRVVLLAERVPGSQRVLACIEELLA
jgi:hypothetical protein